MKVESTFYKVSIGELIKLIVFMLVAVNVFVFLFAAIIGRKIFLFNEMFWVLQVGYPVFYSIVHCAMNKNGELRITEYGEQTKLLEDLEVLISKQGYVKSDKSPDDILYVRKTKFGRIFSIFYNDAIIVKPSKEAVLMYSKRNRLVPFVMKFRYNKGN